MEIGESLAMLTVSDGDVPCPFCASKADPVFETKEMVNDSAALSDSLGGMPRRTMRHPRADFDVFDAYYVTDDISGICMNAHHVLPGNAALAKCPPILQWMAGTTVVKKVFYDKKINMAVKKVHASKRDKRRAQLVAQNYPNETLVGDPEMKVVFSSKPKRTGITRTKTVDKKLVTGHIDFEVNDAKNGEWLPSNNAVVGWASLTAEMAQDFSGYGAMRPFHLSYAMHAMRVTKRQFHDAHEVYSAEVAKKLREIHMELNEMASSCLSHEGTKSKAPDGPFPAPQRLTGALYQLAALIRKEKLTLGTGSKPAAPWLTSMLSVGA